MTQTFGQKMVGITFNPANDDNVTKCKQKMADVIDLLIESTPPDTEIKNALFQMALQNILQAQMMAVKLLTFKE